MVEPGIDIGLGRLEIAGRIGAARETLQNVLDPDGAGRGREVRRIRKFAHHLPAGHRPPRGVERCLGGGLLIGRPRHADLRVGVTAATGRVIVLQEPAVGIGGEQSVPEVGREARRLRTAGRDQDFRCPLGQIEDPRIRDRQIFAAIGLVAAAPQQPHDLQRFPQHPVPDVGRRKLAADDMFVEPLTGTDAEVESAAGDQRQRRGRLRDDRRVIAQRRTSDTGDQPDPFGAFGNRAQDGPGER